MSLPRAESECVRSAYLRALGIEEWVSRGSAQVGVEERVSRVPPRGDAVAAGPLATPAPLVAAPEPRKAPPPPRVASPAPSMVPRVAPPPVYLAPQAPPVAVAPAYVAPPAAPAARAPAYVAPPAAARADDSWDELREEVAGCLRCGLASTRTQTVFGVGNTAAPWLIIGEAPGAEEDRRGEPFVGRGGQLLDAMLQAIGVRRGDNAFIANILKCRPPGNRDPKPEEVTCCLPYLTRQIRLLRPRVILAVGWISAQTLLNTNAPLARLRGRVHSFGELNTPLIVTYHPAYLLRTPADKRKAWEDLKFARGVFAQRGTLEAASAAAAVGAGAGTGPAGGPGAAGAAAAPGTQPAAGEAS